MNLPTICNCRDDPRSPTAKRVAEISPKLEFAVTVGFGVSRRRCGCGHADGRIRVAEAGVIEDVERIHADLELQPFKQIGVLGDGEVGV